MKTMLQKCVPRDRESQVGGSGQNGAPRPFLSQASYKMTLQSMCMVETCRL